MPLTLAALRVSRKALAAGFVRKNVTWIHRRLAPGRSSGKNRGLAPRG